MNLTIAQKKRILKKGFVLIPGLVAAARVDAARREINRALGRSSSYGKEGPVEAADPDVWPGLQGSPAISSLFHGTPVKALVESLIGKGCIDADLQRTVLIRFPQQASARENTSFHIDGFEYGGGLDARNAPSHSHTIAVAVLLSDTRGEGAASLALIPGSHLRLAEYFRAHPEASRRRGMPELSLGAALSVKGRVGDVVLYHYQVAHSAFAFRNLSPDIHCAAVFWAKHVRHDERWSEAMSDLWLEWPGMSEVLPPGPRT